MNILVINSGSSSIKFSVFAADSSQPHSSDHDPRPLLDGELSGIGTPDAKLEFSGSSSNVEAEDSAHAIHEVFDALAQPNIPTFDAVGYRVVHPGPKIDRHIRIDDEVLATLEAAVAFAPLHDPDAIKLIREAMQRFPTLPHFACFDTVFHQTMPDYVRTYPIPLSYLQQGVRRYGFHGLSCESVLHQMRTAHLEPTRFIIAHLGSGCSLTAIANGASLENTMGLTPTGGVVMGTRPGDLDPGLIFYLLRQPGATIDSVEHMLNHDAGIKALFGSNDMRKLRETQRTDRQAARLPIQEFVNSIRKAMAGLCAVHGADAIVFTGGIGEHDPDTRIAVADSLFHDQPAIDPAKNAVKGSGLRMISDEDSSIPVYVVPAEEDLMIAIHVAQMCASNIQ